MKPYDSVGRFDVSVQQDECLSDAVDAFAYLLAEDSGYNSVGGVDVYT